MAKEINKAQVNHLRRLLGWVRCSEGVYQSPEEMKETMRKIAPAFKGGISPEGQQRMVESYRKAESIPLYVRAAIKALEPLVREAEGEVVEPIQAHSKSEYKRLTAQGANVLPPPSKG